AAHGPSRAGMPGRADHPTRDAAHDDRPGHHRQRRVEDVLYGRGAVRAVAVGAVDRLEGGALMQRLEATRVAVGLATHSPIVGGVGNSTFDLVACDRPNNFYMWNSMGMASSIALGLAIARPDLRVVVLDGDGSILMNLGSLATEVTCGVTNLVHVIWDNGGWEITGGQPAGSPFGID